VIILAGRYSGKKGVIVKVNMEGTKSRPFSHCLVVGLQKSPQKVKRKMSEKQLKRANSVRPFAKYINTTHLMPTRYTLDNHAELNPNSTCYDETTKSFTKREKSKEWDDQKREDRKETLKGLKLAFEQRWNNGLPKKSKSKWFYERLRF